MEQKRLNEFTYGFLVNAAQMAYVEEANNTSILLQNFNQVYRYLIRDVELVTLYNEVEVLKKYINVQKTRYENHFSVEINNDIKNKAIFINHLNVINFFDSILHSSLERFEKSININLEFESSENTLMIIKLKYNDVNETFTLNL